MSSSAIRRAPPANPQNASVVTAQVFNLISNPILPAALGIPGKLTLEGKRFTVRAEGNAHTVGAYTCQASLLGALVMPATPLVAASWTLLGSGTARTIAANAWAPWWIQANCIFDSQGGIMAGTFQQMVNNLYDADAALANTITGINGSNQPVTQGGTVVQPTDPAFWMAVAITFGTAGTSSAGLYNFEIGF
jgi:hypothetical protein